jgi:hypothetical protein
MMLITTICLTLVYLRFTTTERAPKEHFSVLNLSTAAEDVYYPESSLVTLHDEFDGPMSAASPFLK